MPEQSNRHRELVEKLGLLPHPEGGHFGEVFRSPHTVRDEESGQRDAAGEARSAVTTVYFLLEYPEFSHWHVVHRDEVWHFYEGEPLELWTVDPADIDNLRIERRVLGPFTADQRPVRVVPAGHWQAARPTQGYTLAGCTVAPGFEFSDFELLREDERIRSTISTEFPWLAHLL